MTWVTVKIGDLGKVITGNTPPKKNPEFYGDAYKFIKPTDMNIGERFTPETEEYYSAVAYEKYRKSLIPSKSTCVVTIGSIGKKMTMTNEECFVNQAVNAIIPNKNYNPFFVYYSIKNILLKVKKADTGASSGRENVSKSNFMSLTIKSPKCLQTQTQIANILCSYDDLIENNLKRIKLLEQAAQNIYKEWFVNRRFPDNENTPIEQETGLPEGWEEKTVGDYVKIISKGPSLNYEVEKGFPVINQSCIRNGEIELEKIRIAAELKENKHYCYLKINDILINSMGQGTLGRVSKNNSISEKYIIHNCITFLRAKDIYSQVYLYQFISSKEDYFISVSQGSTGQTTLKKSLIEDLDIIIPESNLLKKYDSIVMPMWNKIGVLKNQNKKLKSARNILLPRLMNQTIEV